MVVPPLAPGSTIGILGGGQLGRMTVLAAARLGYRCHVYCQQADEPAAQVAGLTTIAAFDDAAALSAFAEAVDVVTFEFENIPVATVEAIEERVNVRPGPPVLAIAQDRCVEKSFLVDIGVDTAAFACVNDADALAAALVRLGRPSVLKTARMGYDGKGQVLIAADTDVAGAWTELAGGPAVIEKFVRFEREISVIVARAHDGSMAVYDPVENQHEHHILRRTLAPAPISAELADRALALALRIAEAIDLVGLLAVEMFVTEDGRLLVNELAPRPHNSGHWTIDACDVSQFEQLVRAVCGLKLGSPARRWNAEMLNLLGDEVEQWPAYMADPSARLHLYGKASARPGRKMGHVTRLSPLSQP